MAAVVIPDLEKELFKRIVPYQPPALAARLARRLADLSDGDVTTILSSEVQMMRAIDWAMERERQEAAPPPTSPRPLRPVSPRPVVQIASHVANPPTVHVPATSPPVHVAPVPATTAHFTPAPQVYRCVQGPAHSRIIEDRSATTTILANRVSQIEPDMACKITEKLLNLGPAVVDECNASDLALKHHIESVLSAIVLEETGPRSRAAYYPASPLSSHRVLDPVPTMRALSPSPSSRQVLVEELPAPPRPPMSPMSSSRQVLVEHLPEGPIAPRPMSPLSSSRQVLVEDVAPPRPMSPMSSSRQVLVEHLPEATPVAPRPVSPINSSRQVLVEELPPMQPMQRPMSPLSSSRQVPLSPQPASRPVLVEGPLSPVPAPRPVVLEPAHPAPRPMSPLPGSRRVLVDPAAMRSFAAAPPPSSAAVTEQSPAPSMRLAGGELSAPPSSHQVPVVVEPLPAAARGSFSQMPPCGPMPGGSFSPMPPGGSFSPMPPGGSFSPMAGGAGGHCQLPRRCWGLDEFLVELGLTKYARAAREWASQMGARLLEEVLENIEDFAAAVGLGPVEWDRIQRLGPEIAARLLQQRPRQHLLFR